jgi:hypothetical protein
MSAMSCSQQLNRGRSESDLSQVLLAIELWYNARIVGHRISASRKVDVLNSLSYWLAKTLCGGQALVLRSDEETDASLKTIREYIKSRNPALAFALHSLEPNITAVSIERCAELLARSISKYLPVPGISVRKAHGISSLQWLTEFGLRVFEQREQVRNWAGNELFSGSHYLLKSAELARVCRFAFLARDLHRRAGPGANA